MDEAKEPKVIIDLAPTDRLDRLGELPYEVVREVCWIDECLITDRSSLLDFREMGSDPRIYKLASVVRIFRVYGVDVSDMEDLNIVKICERIKEFRGTSGGG